MSWCRLICGSAAARTTSRSLVCKAFVRRVWHVGHQVSTGESWIRRHQRLRRAPTVGQLVDIEPVDSSRGHGRHDCVRRQFPVVAAMRHAQDRGGRCRTRVCCGPGRRAVWVWSSVTPERAVVIPEDPDTPELHGTSHFATYGRGLSASRSWLPRGRPLVKPGRADSHSAQRRMRSWQS